MEMTSWGLLTTATSDDKFSGRTRDSANKFGLQGHYAQVTQWRRHLQTDRQSEVVAPSENDGNRRLLFEANALFMRRQIEVFENLETYLPVHRGKGQRGVL